MSDALTQARLPGELLRQVWPRHTAKLAANRFGVAVITVKKWLVEGVPQARREALAHEIKAELARIRSETQKLEEVADTLLRETRP